MKNLYYAIITICFLLITSLNSEAQQPELVKDIDTRLSATVQSTHTMCEVGGYIFFRAVGSGETSNELGVWDGSTYLSFDINPNGTSEVNHFTSLGDKVYFTADDGTSGTELWEFDGTNVTMIDINSSGPSDPSDLVVFGSDLFFSADDGTNGRELWKYDGSSTTLIDIVAGATGSDPEFMTVYNSELIFFADDGVVGNELWKYDGTMASLVEDIRGGSIGSQGSNPFFEIYDGDLYFQASNGATDLWVYDGTDVTLIDVRSAVGNAIPSFMTSFNSKLYFSAFGGDGTTGNELWQYDGTSPSLVEDINPGASSSNVNPKTKNQKFPLVQGYMYFRAVDGTNGEELYKYDGTNLSRIDVNMTTDLNGDAFIDHVGIANDRIYFQAYGGSNFGTELWEYDGSTLSQIVIRAGSESSSVRHMTELDGVVYFTAFSGDGTLGWHLWQYDGTEASPIELTGITESSEPTMFQAIGNNVFFTASTSEFGTELWKSDGVTTEMVADLNPGEDGSYPYSVTAIGSKLFFFAEDDSDDGESLYVYDGSDFQTFAVVGADGDPFVEFNGQVYFTASDGVNGQELWRYDGTDVSLAADINSGGSSRPEHVTVFNDILVFAANDGVNGDELWKFDGSSATLVEDILTGGSSSQPSMFEVVESTLYFRATSSGTGRELGVYDGNTVTIIDVVPGSSQSNPENLTAFNGNLVFTGIDADDGEEVLVYDGMNVTSLDVNPGPNGSFPTEFTEFNGNLYFSARTDAEGGELFRYDGTDVTIIEIVSGTNGSGVGELFVNGPYLYFNAREETGMDVGLHRYDGTNPPEFLAEVERDELEDYPVYAQAENFIYFNGIQKDDEELWRIRAISEETDITAFSFSEQTGTATINAENHTIGIEVIFGTDISSLTPTIEVSDFASINPTSGTGRDFSSGVTYTVTAEFGNTQDWTITTTVAPNNAPTVSDPITDTSLPGDEETTTIDLSTIFVDQEGQTLTFSATSSDESVVTVSVSGNTLTVNRVGVGTATVTITANDGNGGTITDEFTITVEAPVVAGIDDQVFADISVYPNPTSDRFRIDVPEGEWHLQVFEPSGKMLDLDSPIMGSMDISVHTWPVGIYYLRLFNSDHFTTTKILISR